MPIPLDAPFSIWHQLKVTFDTNGITRAYIDGALRGSTNGPPAYGAGNWTLTLGHFDGDIDEVRISNTVPIADHVPKFPLLVGRRGWTVKAGARGGASRCHCLPCGGSGLC